MIICIICIYIVSLKCNRKAYHVHFRCYIDVLNYYFQTSQANTDIKYRIMRKLVIDARYFEADEVTRPSESRRLIVTFATVCGSTWKSRSSHVITAGLLSKHGREFGVWSPSSLCHTCWLGRWKQRPTTYLRNLNYSYGSYLQPSSC